MKFSILACLLSLVFVWAAFAHPGNTASDGCHYCRTNCDKRWVPWNQRHCHGGSSFPSSSYPSYTPSYTPPSYTTPTIYKTPTEECQEEYWINATVGTTSNTCKCKEWYKWATYGDYCELKTSFNTCEDRINWYLWTDWECYCNTWYEWSTSQNKCIRSQTDQERCIELYGINSYSSNDGMCRCQTGYTFNSKHTTLWCISASLSCQLSFSDPNVYSDWIPNTDGRYSCYCKEWYQRDNQWKCTLNSTSTIHNNELEDAIQRMYKNGLTSYDSIEWFMPFNNITREQASKFFVWLNQFILAIKWGSKETNENKCVFSDISNADRTLISYISKACDSWIIIWSKWKFNPNGKLTKAQALTILIRIINGKMDESWEIWFEKYYHSAANKGLLDKLDYHLLDLDREDINRGDMAKLIYRTYLYTTK